MLCCILYCLLASQAVLKRFRQVSAILVFHQLLAVLKLSHFKIPGHLSECFREQGITKLTKSSIYLNATPGLFHQFTPRNGSFENEDRSMKHPNLENQAPKSRKLSTQISKRASFRLMEVALYNLQQENDKDNCN